MIRFLVVGFVVVAAAFAVFSSGIEVSEKVSEEVRSNNLLVNGSLERAAGDGRSPANFTLAGDASYGVLGRVWDRIGRGVRLSAASDLNQDGQHAGELRTTVT